MRTPPSAPPGEGVRIVRTLEALGYPIQWQEKATGCTLHHLLTIPDDDLLDPATLPTLRSLARSLGERVAQPMPGLTRTAIRAAQKHARQDGWHPPMAYEDDGSLDRRAIPEHPWSQADDMAARWLTVAVRLLRYPGECVSDAAAACDVARKTVLRVRARVDALRAADQDPAVIVRAADLWEGGDLPPTLAALRADLIRPDQVPADHPDLAAYTTPARAAAA